jgi:hypothetical protein
MFPSTRLDVKNIVLKSAPKSRSIPLIRISFTGKGTYILALDVWFIWVNDV